jgi:hypothetical protein
MSALFRRPKRPGRGRRHDVLFDAPHAWDVSGGDTERQPLFSRLVVREPEMHDPVPVDDVRRISPYFLFHQFGEELVADRAVIGIDDGRRRALRRCQRATRFARLMTRTSLPSQNDQQAVDPLWL